MRHCRSFALSLFLSWSYACTFVLFVMWQESGEFNHTTNAASSSLSASSSSQPPPTNSRVYIHLLLGIYEEKCARARNFCFVPRVNEQCMYMSLRLDAAAKHHLRFAWEMGMQNLGQEGVYRLFCDRRPATGGSTNSLCCILTISPPFFARRLNSWCELPNRANDTTTHR